MRLSRLNDQGIARFAEWLQAQRSGVVSDPPIALLADSDHSAVVAATAEIEPKRLSTRWEAGKYLLERIESAKVSAVERDSGLWTWLTLLYIDSVCPKNAKGVRKVGEQARYIPDPNNYLRYYRHLLAGPFLVYRAHRDNPEIARCLLIQELDKPGDIVEQLASRQEILTNRNVVELATRLYVNQDGARKHGAGGSGAGSPRRLAEVHEQFALTWDMYDTPSDELMGLLPREFDRFKK